jgi:hypothetical protein
VILDAVYHATELVDDCVYALRVERNGDYGIPGSHRLGEGGIIASKERFINCTRVTGADHRRLI